jgi:hypothetical protein
MWSSVFCDDLGTHRISHQLSVGKTVVSAGQYGLRIDQDQIIFLRKDKEVAKTSLITIAARNNVTKPQVQITKLADQPLVRFRIRSGQNWYYAYLESKE